MSNKAQYGLLVNEEEPDSPKSALRFSQSDRPEYIASRDVVRESGGYNTEYKTPLQSFNASTFEYGTEKPIQRRHKASRIFYCVAAMLCTILLCTTVILSVGWGMHYKCANPAHQKSITFTTKIDLTKVLKITAVNAFLDFESSNDRSATDFVISVRTGAPTEKELTALTPTFTGSPSTGVYNLNIGGEPNQDLDEFISSCLITTITVLVPPSHYFNGTLDVQVTNGKVKVEEISGWLHGNFTLQTGEIELEDIQNATTTRVMLQQGSVELENVQSDLITVNVGHGKSSLEHLDTDFLDVSVGGNNALVVKDPKLRSTSSVLKLYQNGTSSKGTIKVSDIPRGQIDINIPNSKLSVSVLSTFCADIKLTASEFETEGNNIRFDASSTANVKTGTIGTCQDTPSELRTVSKGKLKLIARS